METAFRLWLRFERFAWDIGGVLVLAISLMLLLGLIAPGLAGGSIILGLTSFLRRWLGWGSLALVLAGGAWGLFMIRRRADEALNIRWMRVLALEGATFAFITLLTLVNGGELARAERGLDGGLVGWGLSELISTFLNPFIGMGIVFIALFFFLVVGLDLTGKLTAVIEKSLGARSTQRIPASTAPAVSVAPVEEAESLISSPRKSPKKPQRVAPEFRKRFRVEQNSDERPASPIQRSEDLPSLDLLANERSAKPSERHINQRAGMIEQTLDEFGIPAKVVGFQVGPTVTQFAVEPGYIAKPGATADEIARLRKVRVSQIAGLQRDLALSLAAERLRIQAPVPGRSYIGIEVPNATSSIVRLRPLLESNTFQKVSSPLAIALGRDVSGEAVVADLSSMPHLLIAGTTGSGKSVNIASITTCLAMNNSPKDLRLVMIDPKMVELIRFNGLPHLYGKVETQLERILGVLRWVVAEMDQRYILLEESRSRNIDTYNRKIGRRKEAVTLPRIVVLIDELADLMMSAPEQTEHTLVRLAQMARATGIHLVLATQRPSTDVVTGLIKANFPARISFAVASSIDSRVILDVTGAEHLLGSGDMLFLPPEAGSPIRVQGVWITDQELERVVNFWQKSYQDDSEEIPPWEQMLEKEAVLSDRDGLIEQAVRLVQQTQKASTSMLQRQLRVGYPRAARLMDELEELGVVGFSQGSGRERDVLIGEDEDLMDILADQD
ncbi:MAG: DNA translocase FtsK [Anaerolineales bacterium]|nr:DNA translocase FtsK [Chloroflexota bacterium]MBL6981324.1 DNA translocase FtsK [Anaerolineales bacterium]